MFPTHNFYFTERNNQHFCKNFKMLKFFILIVSRFKKID